MPKTRYIFILLLIIAVASAIATYCFGWLYGGLMVTGLPDFILRGVGVIILTGIYHAETS